MGVLTAEIMFYLFAAAVLGVVIGFLIRGAQTGRVLEQAGNEWQERLDHLIREKNQLAAKTTALRSNIEDQQVIVRQQETTITRQRTDLESSYAKQK